MTPDQDELLHEARASLDAARVLRDNGFHGFAASRAYYAMFYAAQAVLLGKELSFSKHSGVQAAFGQHFAKTGIIAPVYHRYLIEAFEARQEGDYERVLAVGPEVSDVQIERAKEFIEMAEKLLGTASGEQADREAGN